MRNSLKWAALAMLVSSCAAQAKTVCTIIADASTPGILGQSGDCETRVTPASTFKIALAVMGFDSGFLKDSHAPFLPFREGYPDFGGADWKQPTDPMRWLQYSVVWYSQQITHALGEKTLHDYATKFRYGNADFSGDLGKDNGLDRAWIASSLSISPLEQVNFLRQLVGNQLPVNAKAIEEVKKIVGVTLRPNGFEVHGKTGMAFPRNPDYSFNEANAYGWFVGWIIKDTKTYVFARLIQDENKQTSSAGNRARDSLLSELPSLLSVTPQTLAAGSSDRNWKEEKCVRYKAAWARFLLKRGSAGLGPEFMQTHDQFLASDCSIRSVCPVSREELDVANTLTILAMNAGTASTFLPFSCSKR